jgi:hypothetical protein
MVFGGLKVEGCPSKYGIRSIPLLGLVCFWLYHWCSVYIRRLCIVVLLFPASVHLVQRPVILLIKLLPLKKKFSVQFFETNSIAKKHFKNNE